MTATVPIPDATRPTPDTIAAWEFSLGGHLTVKGFRPSVVAALPSAASAAPAVR